jgi:hypothetical protein
MGEIVSKVSLIETDKNIELKETEQVTVILGKNGIWDVYPANSRYIPSITYYNRKTDTFSDNIRRFNMNTPQFINLRWVEFEKQSGQYMDFFPIPIGIRTYKEKRLLADWNNKVFSLHDFVKKD